ncbi:hypothetical protein HDU85_007780 [Gaertneriomyces sp. JEL0708]|nr:hypothetical protein HDU85_007780 [Gaertneriomyces sp. JEL0708]
MSVKSSTVSGYPVTYFANPPIPEGTRPAPTPSPITPDSALATSPADLMTSLCLPIRFKVFVLEQKCTPESECDELDCKSFHFVIWSKDEVPVPMATCRMIPYPEKGYAKVGRLAVLQEHRGKGLGRVGMTAVEAVARDELKVREILLHAQSDKRIFYERCGYVVDESKERWFEEGIEHIMMSKTM